MSSFRIPPNSHLAMIIAAIFAVGLGMGAAIVSMIQSKKIDHLERTNASIAAFNQAQATTISRLSLNHALPQTVSPVVAAPQPAVVAPMVPPPAQATPVVTPPVVATPPNPQPPKVQTRPAPPAPRQEPPKPVAAPVAKAPERTTPAQALEALKLQKQAAATPSPAPPPPATVTMQQAGIAGIDTASVKFASGRVVTIGGEFPTGEKLISVNPTDGRIVTDRRVIQLAKPAPVQ